MTWLDIAKNLPQNQHTRGDCPVCGEGTNTNAAIINHNSKYYSIYCNACDNKEYSSKGMLSLEERKRINDLNEQALTVVHKIELPKDTTYEPTEFSRDARTWLFKGGLSPSQWVRHRIGYSKRLERVILPVYDSTNSLIWFQCRAILSGQKPKYIQPTGDRSKVYYAAGDTRSTKRAVAVEDIMSAIRVGDAVRSSQTTVVSLLGTKVTAGQAEYLSNFDEVTTWFDGDRAGKTGSKNVRQLVGLLTTCNNVRTVEDPKFYSNKHIKEILNVY